MLNYTYTAYGIWYSTKLFADRGWQYAKTWDEHIALCKKIKAAGIAPWTYAGKHPRYMSWPLISTAIKFGGPSVATAIDNLEPNAWKSDAMKAAADAWHQIVKDKLHPRRLARPGPHRSRRPPGARARPPSSPAAPGWRASRRTSPRPGFNMTVAPTPSLGGGDKLPFEAIRGTAGEPFIVPAKAKNVAGGLEYLRTMLSKQGRPGLHRRRSPA